MLNKIIRNIYCRLLVMSRYKSASIWLFLLAFVESFIFPIPPDVMLIPMCLAKNKKAIYYSLLCTFASAVGGIIGYVIGMYLWHTVGGYIVNLYHLAPYMEKLKGLYAHWGILLLLLAGFTPIPYKVFTIFSGLMGMSFPLFFIISFFSRGLRFVLIGLIFYFFGKKAKHIIHKYLVKLTVIFSLLIIVAFIIYEILK